MSDIIYYKDYMDKDFFIPEIITYKKKQYCDDIFTFDIECCNFFVSPEGEVLSINDIFQKCDYDPDETEKYFDKCEAGGLPYIWMFGVDMYIVYGRELADFKIFIDYMADKIGDIQAQIFIHNFSYEHTFLREIFKFDAFYTHARKPLFAVYKCFTFRCSYRLTNISLEKWGEEVGMAKKVGDLDYHAMYTPLTKLDDRSLGYCWADIDIMKRGLANYKKLYKHMHLIPYTQTGMPRRDIKNITSADKKLLYFVASCQPKTPEAWKVQNQAYSGGLTLCNPRYAGKPLNNIASYDKKSAYPFAMLWKYPSSAFIRVLSDPIWEDGNHHICLVEYRNFTAKYDITPQSSSKRILLQGAVYGRDGDGLTKNNGKIIHADRAVFYITEHDKRLLDMYYTYDTMLIHSHWIATSAYMPKKVVEYMLKLYANKTLLKGGDPVFYNREKAKLNSIYGLCATALSHAEILEDGYDFVKKYKTDAEIQEELNGYQTRLYKNTLPYSWGLYITSAQRYMLMEMAHKAHIDKLVYTDTDSLKGFYSDAEREIFEKENERIIAWTEERCREQGIDPELTRPKTPKGDPQYLGTWENDENYLELQVLGAKRYAYRIADKNGNPENKIHITIAGVPKAAGNELHSVEELKENLKFNVYNSRKNLAIYRDGDNPQVTMPDGYQVTNKCACCIRPTSYTLTLTQDYRDLIAAYNAKKI